MANQPWPPVDWQRSSRQNQAMWNVTVVNGLQASFNQPHGPSRPGHDWIVLLSRGSEQKRTMIRTYSDRYPSLSHQGFATAATEFVKQQIGNGWDPCSTADPPETLVPDEFVTSIISDLAMAPHAKQKTKRNWWRFW
jgi:hypothetical protein